MGTREAGSRAEGRWRRVEGGGWRTEGRAQDLEDRGWRRDEEK
jgi:hypothetical protein